MLLAIDDDSGRYDGLRLYLRDRLDHSGKHIDLKVVCCAACIDKYLPEATAILLDYDLDSGELCAECGSWPEQLKSMAYINKIIARNVPTIVTSCSDWQNVMSLSYMLSKHKVLTAQHNAHETECELRWLGRLAIWGVL